MRVNVPSKHIALKFVPGSSSPALLRPLSEQELKAVALFVAYYRDVIYPSGKSLSSFLMPFKEILKENGIDTYGYTSTTKGTLFKGLWKYAGDESVYASIRRAVGFPGQLNYLEKGLLFKAIVDRYQKLHGKDALPGEEYFKELNEKKAFIPEVGMTAPTSSVFYLDYKSATGKEKAKWRELFSYYYSPDELSQAVIEKNFITYSLEDLIQNYLKVNEHIHQQNPAMDKDRTPTAEDIRDFAISHGGIPWGAYSHYFERLREQGVPANERGINWLRMQSGLQPNKETVTQINRATLDSWLDGQGNLDIQKVQEHFLKAWVYLSPGLCDVSKGVLYNPPRHADVNFLSARQTQIINDHGSITPELAREFGVPETLVPSMSLIVEDYPGGPQGLMHDIEMKYCVPHGRKVEFTPDRNGQLARLAAMNRTPGREPGRTIELVRSYFG